MPATIPAAGPPPGLAAAGRFSRGHRAGHRAGLLARSGPIAAEGVTRRAAFRIQSWKNVNAGRARPAGSRDRDEAQVADQFGDPP